MKSSNIVWKNLKEWFKVIFVEMSETEELIIEIDVKKLPAIPFLKECGNVATKWRETLAQNGLDSECEFYYTPRRIVFYHPNSHCLAA